MKRTNLAGVLTEHPVDRVAALDNLRKRYDKGTEMQYKLYQLASNLLNHYQYLLGSIHDYQCQLEACNQPIPAELQEMDAGIKEYFEDRIRGLSDKLILTIEGEKLS